MNGLAKHFGTLVTAILFTLSINAQAASILAAERAVEQQNYSEALDELKPLVRDGDAEALYLQGVLTRDGLGLSADKNEAMRLFESAARQGHLESVNALRAIKNEEYKVEFDRLLSDAEGGKASAQNRIGEMYEYGQGVARNLTSAYEWYRKAASQGLLAAVHNLGRAYNFGTGTEVDYQQAEAFYREAAAQGYADSMFFLGTLYATKNGNEKQTDPDQLAYAWMNAASERGNQTAGVIKQRLLMKLDEAGRSEAEAMAAEFVATYVTPFN